MTFRHAAFVLSSLVMVSACGSNGGSDANDMVGSGTGGGSSSSGSGTGGAAGGGGGSAGAAGSIDASACASAHQGKTSDGDAVLVCDAVYAERPFVRPPA